MKYDLVSTDNLKIELLDQDGTSALKKMKKRNTNSFTNEGSLTEPIRIIKLPNVDNEKIKIGTLLVDSDGNNLIASGNRTVFYNYDT